MPLHAGKRMNKMIHKLTWKDFAVIKLDIIVFALLLAHIFPVLASAHWGWYVAIIVTCEAYLWDKLFGNHTKVEKKEKEKKKEKKK